MGGATLPPGFRFHPTDEELVGYYLKRKVERLPIELEVIPVVDLYKCDPWELPEKSFLPIRDMEWFFFCPRDRKYPNGTRTNRATKSGYWKATGKDKKVVCQTNVMGYRKTLVFYRGRAPSGDRTDWVMHEYRLCDDLSQESPSFQGAFALCRVVKKNEHTQKMNDHGEPKAKRAGRSLSNGDHTSMTIPNVPISIPNEILSQASYPCNESQYSSPITSPYEVHPMAESEPALMKTSPTNFWVPPELILDSSKDYPQVQEAASEYPPQYQYPSSSTSWPPYEHAEIASSSSYSNFNGEVEVSDDLSGYGCMFPYSEHANYMGLFGSEDVTYEGYDQSSSLSYPRLF
ncbi:hypothetical protein I3842_12G060000 [Carya illinoinensis]|uniref:NAC domain-containing protein n=1 Tax=Carya illinoinensis TaxID=32201 RepID=A0A922IWP5_CARIL|nr:hypothetical protein I3842_12G060000 [Carya illinoinensis]